MAGLGLAFVAYANFAFQDNTEVILAIQWYIVTFHFGAIWYHIRLGHHPAVGMAPGIFIPIALTIIGTQLEKGWWYVMPLGTFGCATAAFLLCRVLVKAPPHSPSSTSADALLGSSREAEQTLLNH